MAKAPQAITVVHLRKVRDEILRNIREHCDQLYRRGSMTREACRVAAAIAAAEVADVFKERFGIKL